MQALLSFAECTRRHYQSIIIAAVVLGLVLGLVTIAPGRTLQPFSQALTFVIQMLVASLFYRYLQRQNAPH